jgi:flagellar hook-length control protein FliK
VPAVDPLLAALVAAPVPSTTTAATTAATLPAGPVAQDADGSAPVPAFTITPAGEEPGTATEGDVPLDARTVAAPRPGAISLAGLPAAALVADAATAEPPVAPQQQPAFTQTGTPAGSPAAVAPVATDPAGTLARSVADADRPQVPTADRMPMPAADRPADASAATVGQGAAPAGPAASVAGRATLPGNYGLQLAETIREMREVAHVAAMRGGAQARLQLHPAELGGVGVRLTVTAEGLTARLVADRPEAVHALQQAGAELRRSLEDRGLTLVSLDVQLTASAGGGAAREHAAERGQDGAPTSTTSRRTDAADPSDGMEPDAATTTVRTPSGVLVDVLA